MILAVDGPGLRYAIFTRCCYNCLAATILKSHDINGGYIRDKLSENTHEISSDENLLVRMESRYQVVN